MSQSVSLISVKNDSADIGPVLFLQIGGKIKKVVVREEIALREKWRRGILDTIRYLKGDPESHPASAIVEATDVSKAFFDGEFDRGMIEKMTAEYLEELPRECESLLGDADELEQLGLSVEAGLLGDPKCPAGVSALALLVRLKNWDGPF